MRQNKRMVSLLLTAALCVGLMCAPAGAEASGGASSSVIPEEASQGAVAQVGDTVTLTGSDGTVLTFSDARLGGTLSFTEPDPYYEGRQVELKTIIAQPGCVAYTDNAAAGEEDYYSVFCYEFAVKSDGTFGVEGWHDMSFVGDTDAMFGLDREMWGYSVVLTAFYADDGRYCVTTQEALDRFCQLTDIPLEEPEAEPLFTDVAPDAWYYDFVNTVAEKGLFAGNGDGTFAPENNMTYAEFLAVLFQFSGDTLPANSGPNWYDNHVQWAKNSGVIPSAMLAGFDPEAAITRQDMAALFGTFLSLYDYEAEPVNSVSPSFSDEGSIADYAKGGVALCYQLGIMNGNDDGTFAPGSNAIRAEVAVTMVQMARVMGR